MAQSGGTYNLVIQDTNGNPQYIKLQKGQSPATKVLKTDSKLVRNLIQKPSTPGVAQVVNASGTILQTSPQVVRTLKIPGKPARHFVTIPLQSSIQKNAEQMSPTLSLPNPASVTASPTVGHTGTPQNTIKIGTPISIVDSTGSRKRVDSGNDYSSDAYVSTIPGKRRKTEKCGKGLRHFSMKVCEKVRKKGLTSYNEVADELVSEFTDPKHIPNSIDQQYDQKNIRRRVYDALNVLMAMNIISKEKKEIRWLGLPTSSAQECVSLMTEKKQISERIQTKTQQLNDLLLQQISYKNLIQRNFEMEKLKGPPASNSVIQLPFIVVNSDKKTIIDCSITNDKTEYLFVFNDKFEINDDFAILKQIGLTHGLERGAEISDVTLEKIKSFVPKSMEKYITKMITDYSNGLIPGDSFKDGLEDDEEIDEDRIVREIRGAAGPSSDLFTSVVQEHESNVDDTSDEESNLSTDVEIN